MGLEDDVAELTRRVAELEGRLAGLEQPTAGVLPPGGSVPTTTFPPPPPLGQPPAAPYPAVPPPGAQPSFAPPPSAGPPSRPRGAINAGVDSEVVLKWAGLGLVVLAAIFLVGTAINRGWIGPELQLLGATLAGVGLIAGAFRLLATNRPWAITLASGGAIVLPICAAAGNAGLDLYANIPAMVLVGLTTVGLGAVAHQLRMEAVAALASISALILWLWIGDDPKLSVFVVAGWLGAVTVAFIVFTLIQRWTATRLLTLFFAMPIILAVALSEGGDDLGRGPQATALVLLFVVAAAAWLAPAIRLRLDTGSIGWLEGLEHRAVLVLPMWFWGSTVAVLGIEERQELAWFGFGVIALFMAALAVGHFGGLLTRRLVLSHGLGIGILLTVALILLVTDGPVLLVVLAAQALATGVLGWRFDDRLLQLQAAGLGAISLLWATGSMLEGLFDPLEVGQHVANGLVVALLIASAVAVGYLGRFALSAATSVTNLPSAPTLADGATPSPNVGTARTWSRLLAVVGWVAALLWIAAVFIHGPQGQVIISVLWAIAGATAIVVGVRVGDGLARTVGLVTLAVVVIKLLSIDLASVDTLWRVGLFFVVGAGLLRLGYLLPRLSGTAQGEPPQAPPPQYPPPHSPPQGPPPQAPAPQYPPPTVPPGEGRN